jgi:hypothetical protein
MNQEQHYNSESKLDTLNLRTEPKTEGRLHSPR